MPPRIPVARQQLNRLSYLHNINHSRYTARSLYQHTKSPRSSSIVGQFPTTRRPSSQLSISHSQIGYTGIAVIFIGAAAVAAYLWPSGPPSRVLIEEKDAFAAASRDLDIDMAVVAQPGRPGSLTPEQEVKLRQLWDLALRIFGVINAPAEAAPATQSTPAPAEKKKNRLSMFSRKKGDDDVHTPASPSVGSPTTANIVASIEQDDKHGLAKTFQQALATMTPEEIRTSFWSMVKHDHPDALLLRFLRARKWDVNAALVMAISALHWRATESHVDSDIMFKGEEGMAQESLSSDTAVQKEGNDFMAQIRLGKSFLYGSDKEGRPVCICRARMHRPGEQSEASLERFTVYIIETARLYLQPPVDTATIVFDLSDFSMSNMDYTPVKFMIKCFEANYPESLGTVLVHKAPWLFQGVWRIVKGWLDPVVAGKVHFTNTLDDLSTFIDQSQIIRELGGPNNWEYSYVEPVAGENERMKDVATRGQLEEERKQMSGEYEDAVIRWIGTDRAGNKSAEAEMDATTARQQRDAVAAKLRDNYWKLDPYVRARSVYDRMGLLKAGTSMAPTPTTQ